MLNALKYLLFAIGLVTLATGLNVIFGGASAVPGVEGETPVSVDNELRFFAVFWVAYGLFCAWVASDLSARQNFVYAIALMFFLGGVARVLSHLSLGAPSGVLIGATVLELVLPIVIVILKRRL